MTFAETTWRTRRSQWKKYLLFCESIQATPIPATSTLICRFIVYLSDTLKYVSIMNYVSAICSLHKLFGYSPLFRTDFMVQFTLSGLRRYLSDPPPNRPTLLVEQLLCMYSHVDLCNLNERAMWACVVFSFRTLLRKCNLVVSNASDIHVIRRQAIIFYPWGMLVRVSSSKTVQYGQRVLEVPVTCSPSSPLCAVLWVKQHLIDFPSLDTNSNFFKLLIDGQQRDMSYSRLLGFLKMLLRKSGVDPSNVGLHSLRRAGAAFMHSVGLTLEDIRQAGDWQSLAALLYLAKPLSTRVHLDQRVSSALGCFNT